MTIIFPAASVLVANTSRAGTPDGEAEGAGVGAAIEVRVDEATTTSVGAAEGATTTSVGAAEVATTVAAEEVTSTDVRVTTFPTTANTESNQDCNRTDGNYD